MKYKLIILFLILTSCAQNYTKTEFNKPFTSKGFAYIYNNDDFLDKIIKKQMDNTSLQIAHSSLRPGALIKIINIKTNDSLILKNNKRFDYPDFYKILVTEPVAQKINLDVNLPLVEIIEVKKNKSFVAKKTKIYTEEKKVPNKAPVETVMINNISKGTNNSKKNTKDQFFIVIGEFYSNNSALYLKKRITKELTSFNSKKLYIRSKKSNKISLLSGPYNSINSMKNDYIQLKNFGFEELDISINE